MTPEQGVSGIICVYHYTLTHINKHYHYTIIHIIIHSYCTCILLYSYAHIIIHLYYTLITYNHIIHIIIHSYYTLKSLYTHTLYTIILLYCMYSVFILMSFITRFFLNVCTCVYLFLLLFF